MKQSHRHDNADYISCGDHWLSLADTGCIWADKVDIKYMLPLDAISILQKQIEATTKLNVLEAYKLAVWIYKSEHDDFSDECLA